jgi:hypothetical protein
VCLAVVQSSENGKPTRRNAEEVSPVAGGDGRVGVAVLESANEL